jgi:hypothetical protein
MSKIKMRCIACGKWFQSANAKEVTCPECMQKARKEKLAAKAVPPTTQKTTGQSTSATGNSVRSASLPSKQKPVSSGTNHWFDSINDVKVSEPDPPQRPKLPPSPAPYDSRGGPAHRGPNPTRDERGPGNYWGSNPPRNDRAQGNNNGGYRGPAAYHNAPLSGSIVGGIGQRLRPSIDGSIAKPSHSPRSGDNRIDKYRAGASKESRPVGQKRPRPPAPPKPKKEKIPPPEPFNPTQEQISQVENRYKELAIPAEFDGIRSQIAHELSIPKKAVKQIVKTLRERDHIPSWWETQTYKGDNEEKEKIKFAYQPYLPIPPVGVHRQIADELDLKPGIVYQAVKTIRQELSLPQYNDPTLHSIEFEELKRKSQAMREAKAAQDDAQPITQEASNEQPTTVFPDSEKISE